MKRIQVIIPAINLWAKYSKPCIESVVKACEGYDYRILFIDNGSTDETIVEAGKLVSDRFSHHRNEKPWGCAQSWNFGVKDAFERGYDLVLILNNDILLHEDSVVELVHRMSVCKPEDKDKPVAMVTCMDVKGECPQPLAVFDLKVEDKLQVAEAENPCFSAFMIDKNCWEKIGEFDEEFRPAYFEDNDYHYRINLAGMKAIVLPTAMFYHYGSGTQNEALDGPVVTGPLFERNRDYYKIKWGDVPGQETFTVPFNKHE